jgi:hypothetical protein
MERTAKKPCSSNAAHVRCTCSIQGLKEQNTPSGRRHWAADATACTRNALCNFLFTSACAEAVHVRMVMLTQVFVLVSHTSVMSHDAFAKKSHTAGLTDLAQM